PTPPRAPCPNCGGQSGIRVCPCCRSELSANFGTAASPLIGMVGARGTGKTVYLTVLAHEMRTNLRRRFAADVRLSGDRPRGAVSPLRWLQQNINSVYEDPRLPLPTPQSPDGRREPVVFEWRQEYKRLGVRPLRPSHLSFFDTAGDDLTSQQQTHDLAYL